MLMYVHDPDELSRIGAPKSDEQSADGGLPETEWRDEARWSSESLLAAESSRTQHRNEQRGFGRNVRRDTGRSAITGLPAFPARIRCHGRAET